MHAFGGRPGAAAEDRAAGAGMLATSIKPYPCCRYIHGCLDLLLALVREEGLRAQDVESVRCGILGAGWDLVAAPEAAKRRIAGQVDAQFSMPFAAALALRHGRATLEDFEAAPELAGELEDLMARVDCRRSDRLDAAFPAAWGAEVEVRTRSGETLARARPDAPGSPAQPLSDDALLAKATGLVGAERAERMLRACRGAADGAPLAAQLAELSPPRPSSGWRPPGPP